MADNYEDELIIMKRIQCHFVICREIERFSPVSSIITLHPGDHGLKPINFSLLFLLRFKKKSIVTRYDQ